LAINGILVHYKKVGDFILTSKEIFAGESDNIEFKIDIPSKSEKYMKTAVAFANGTGGKIIFGVENDTWKVTGFTKDEVFQKMDAITNAIYDSCEPKITPNVALQEIDGKAIIVVEILEGMQRPYYIKSLGITEGTFIRVSGTTRHAERYMLQELILEGTNRSFDQLESDESISEDQIADFCARLYCHAQELCNSDDARKQLQRVGKNQLISWKLIMEQAGKYNPTNGYFLLDGQSDKFPEATIQCALFKGIERNIFITRKEFAGPIYQQIEDAYNFVLQHINLGSRIEGLYREDIYELPIKTLREIIANAVCHRSYLTPGKIQVALFDDRLEVTSPGMLDNEITIEKMKSGLSKVRNKGIAAAFSYMNIIEAWGSGVPRMFREVKEYGLREPGLINLGSDFRVNLYRKPLGIDQHGVIKPKNPAKSGNAGLPDNNQTVPDISGKMENSVRLTEHELKVIRYIKEKHEITTAQAMELLAIKERRARSVLSGLSKKNILKRVGGARNTAYLAGENFLK